MQHNRFSRKFIAGNLVCNYSCSYTVRIVVQYRTYETEVVVRLQEVISAAHLEVSTAPKVFKGRPSYSPP